MRVLDEDELRWVSGAGVTYDSNGWVVEPNPFPSEPIPTGHDPYNYDPFPVSTGGGTGSTVTTATSFPIDDGCGKEKAATRAALNALYSGSAIAREYIDQAYHDGANIDTFEAHPSGFAGGDQYLLDGTKTIKFDPFAYLTGNNIDGTPYSINPTMLLAHELVHAANAANPAYQGAASEALVMSIANRIAAEMNASNGTHYDTHRDKHDGGRYMPTDSVTSNVYSISRPRC